MFDAPKNIDLAFLSVCSITGRMLVTYLQTKAWARRNPSPKGQASEGGSLSALRADDTAEPAPRYRRREVPKDHVLPALGTRRLL